MLAKMNSKVGYLIRTITCLHVCDSKLGPSFRTAMRTYMLGISRHKSAIQSMNLRIFMLNVSPCWLESSLRLLSQGMPDFSKNDCNAQEQNAMKILLDEHVVQSSPSALGPLEEDRSVVEENLVVKSEKSQSQQFFEDLHKCTSSCDVLDLVSKSAISYKYCSNCFTAMWTVTRKMSKDQKLYERELMFKHPAFQQLCQHLMQESRSMWCDDLVYSLHALVKLGISQNTRLVQTLLRVCQERLNEFDNRCVSVVANTLTIMEQSKNVDALQAGIWLLVEQQIPKISDVFMLQSLMKCIGKDAPLSLKRKLECTSAKGVPQRAIENRKSFTKDLEELRALAKTSYHPDCIAVNMPSMLSSNPPFFQALNKILKELDRFSSSDAQQTFRALAAMNYCSFPILNACSNKIIVGISLASFEESIHVLRSCSILQYHNVALCSAVANYMTSSIFMWNTDEIILLLSVFEDLGFRAVELMDIFAEKVTSDPELLDLKAILIVLRVYSRLNHVPKCQNEFLESLNNALNMYLPRISNVDLLKAVFSFCTLGYLPQPALSQLLQEDILNELLTSDGVKKEQNNMMLHYMNVCLELDSPSSFTKPATLFIKKSSLRLGYGFPEVQEALLKLLRDPSMFQQNIQLPYDYNIDFKIKMDADRKKVLPVTEADDPADDLDVQRLAVLCGHISDFCVGTSHPQGKLAMKIRHLKALGYHVILVHYPKFKALKKEEAIKWLKGKIYSAEAFRGPCVNLQDNC